MMIRIGTATRRSLLALASGPLLGFFVLSGCSPEGANSAPKLKGSKDEIQKATQSGVPGRAKMPGGKRGTRG
jgi:hypothetical protein